VSRTRGDADRRTHRRVLDVAIRQFAANGFKKVTIRAICREAGANVAAVNYHFRDKLGLYRQVLEAAVTVMTETTEAARQATEGLAAEDKLRAYIRVVARRIFAQGADSWVHQLINREMSDPTPVMSTLVDRGLRPRLELLGGIIAELLDLPATDERVLLCVSGIHAQVIMLRPSPIGARLQEQFKLRALTPELVADHVAAFSIAGLTAFATRRNRRQRHP